jgi:endonuclease/exonuclease/phosphatase family metal-dependent hydrolase
LKTPLLVQALFHGIATGVSFFLLACGEPSEAIQKTSGEEKLTHESSLASVLEFTPSASPVSVPSHVRLENKADSQGAFTVFAHNVQNLFDLDGVSAYNDYKPEYYGASQLQRKLANLTNLLARFGEGSGPDVVLLQEIELDRTAERNKSAAELLDEALRKKGLGPYHLVEGRIKGQSLKESPSIVCVTLSKFPVEEVRMHPLERARPILETRVAINGKPLILFNNHWKSGASSASLEKVRLGNAQVLRKRIDTLLAADPAVDFIVGGDLNSHYNQKQANADTMPKTGVNDVLLSHGDETVMLKPTRKLYNLWHELPPKQRGSDVWKGEWGTLMHLILSHGLYDDQGIQYVADSFSSVRLSDFNLYPETGTPRRWSNDFGGLGVSDHLPIVASFRTASKGKPVAIGKNHSSAPRDLPQVDYSKALAKAQPFTQGMATSANYGQIFSFSGNLALQKPLTLEIDGRPIQLWSFDPLVKEKLFALKKGDKLSGYGYLSRYRGKWQLLIENAKWLIE